jgi:hypothetical protein
MSKYNVGGRVYVDSEGLRIDHEEGTVEKVYDHPHLGFVYYLVGIPYKTGKRVVVVNEDHLELVDG